MKTLLFTVAFALVVYVAYAGFLIARKVQVADELVRTAEPYQKDDGSVGITMLVVGDSTAVGVGASPGESVPALFARHIGASVVENRAVSGARARDLEQHIAGKKLPRYDVVLMQVGANDIMYGARIDKTVQTIAAAVRKIAPHAGRVYVLTAGDIGATTIFPWPLRRLYHSRTLSYHAKAEEILPAAGAVYVNLYRPSVMDPFVAEPEKYLAEDGLHPSAAGYRLWFEALRDTHEAPR